MQTLDELVSLMETRDRDRVTNPRIVIVLDELADLVQTGGGEVIDLLGRLVQRGRQAGMHMIGATQKPSSAILGPLVKANFPVRLVGRVVSSEDARVAAGIGGTGAERLIGHGDFVAVSGLGVTRFQAAFISPGEMIDVAAKLSNGKRRTEIVRSDDESVSGNDRAESDVLRSAMRMLKRVK